MVIKNRKNRCGNIAVKLNRTRELLLDLIYPRRCPVCDSVLPFRGGLICSACAGELEVVREPSCRKCGRKLFSETAEYCRDCLSVSHTFDRCISAFIYNDAMQGAIFKFKYGNRKEYAQFFVQSMARIGWREIKTICPDALIPVPLHKKRLSERGFNQAELLAKGLSKELGIPVITGLLERRKNTVPQKMLSREARRKNLKKAFQLSSCDVKLKRVIVIDDIYTTGSTLDEIAFLLKGAGVQEVYGFTLCSGISL